MKCRLVLLRENSVEIADKADISCVLCQKDVHIISTPSNGKITLLKTHNDLLSSETSLQERPLVTFAFAPTP